MTSPLVKPVAGYMTLSKLDSSSSRPAIRTSTRSFIGRLRGVLVGAQPDESWEAEPPITCQRAVPYLHHENRLNVGRSFEILAWNLVDERRPLGLKRTQPGQEVPLGGRRNPAPHAAPVPQPARPGCTDEQSAQCPATDPPG